MKDEENLINESAVSNSEVSENEDLLYVESTEDGEELPKKDSEKKLREDLKVCRKEKEEYLTGWQRSKADYINLQKELHEVRQNVSLLTKEKIITDFLPVIDSFDMAFSNKEAWEKVDSNWRMGVTYIYQQFMKSLYEMGVEKIDQLDVVFDPNNHHSVSSVETKDESKDHHVMEILQIGFKLKDRVIRPAKVKIYEYKKQ